VLNKHNNWMIVRSDLRKNLGHSLSPTTTHAPFGRLSSLVYLYPLKQRIQAGRSSPGSPSCPYSICFGGHYSRAQLFGLLSNYGPRKFRLISTMELVMVECNIVY
jgi:hypothetical protein